MIEVLSLHLTWPANRLSAHQADVDGRMCQCIVAIGRTVTVLNLKTLVGLNRLVFCGLVKVIEIIERDNPLSG